jgi:hypothetical protein
MIKNLTQSSLTNDIKYRSMSVGNLPSSEYLIQSYVLNTTTASVEFDVTGLGSQFRHLQLAISAISPSDVSFMRFNGDSGSNYRVHGLRGNGSTVSSYVIGGSAQTNLQLSTILASNTTYTKVIDILDAFNTNKNTTIRGLIGNSNQGIELISGVYLQTAAITSIFLRPFTGSYSTGSRFSLYGVTA